VTRLFLSFHGISGLIELFDRKQAGWDPVFANIRKAKRTSAVIENHSERKA
jgi:hypothetical protein